MRPTQSHKTLKRRIIISLLCAALIVATAATAWRWTPLSEWAEPHQVAQQIRALAHTPWMPLAIAALYVIANFLLFPNTLLNAGTILALGSGWGIVYALGGSLFAGSIHYGLGRRYGEDKLDQMDVPQLDTAIEKLQNSGLPGIATIRMLPIAPYPVVNLMMGAAGVTLPMFLIGSAIGLLPGALMVTAFGHQLERLIKQPDPMQIVGLVATLVMAVAVLWGLRRLAQSRLA